MAAYLGTYCDARNQTDPTLGDPELCQALFMAIDREFLAEEIFQSTMVPATSFVPPGIGNLFQGDMGPSFIYRDLRAHQILDEGLPVSMQLVVTAALRAGSIVVKRLFNYLGIGRFFVQGALNRDCTLVMGTVVIVAVFEIDDIRVTFDAPDAPSTRFPFMSSAAKPSPSSVQCPTTSWS